MTKIIEEKKKKKMKLINFNPHDRVVYYCLCIDKGFKKVISEGALMKNLS